MTDFVRRASLTTHRPPSLLGVNSDGVVAGFGLFGKMNWGAV
jgi:hypothetical protein